MGSASVDLQLSAEPSGLIRWRGAEGDHTSLADEVEAPMDGH